MTREASLRPAGATRRCGRVACRSRFTFGAWARDERRARRSAPYGRRRPGRGHPALEVSRGRDAYEGFLGWLDSPGAVVLSAIILAGVLYHTITWLRLTAHIQVVRLGRRVIPRRLVLAGLLTLWVAVSAIIAYLHIWL